MAGQESWPLPAPRLALLAILGATILPLAPSSAAWLWWLGYNGVLFALTVGDWLVSPRAAALTVTPDVKAHWVRGERQTVRLLLASTASGTVALELRQDVSRALGGPAASCSVRLAPGAEAVVTYDVTPRERGAHKLVTIHGRRPSRFGLLVLPVAWDVEVDVRVYAPLYMDQGPALIAPRQQSVQAGSALVRQSGVHTEFESLREYREGDEFRAVNWRASARRGKLVVNQYQAERTQQVMLVLDCGRLMVPEYGGVPRFEYALSAALQLGRLAAEREDRVGMMLFGAKVEAMLNPARGQAQVARLAEAAHRIKPEMTEPDYAGSLTRLSGSLRRRSLVLVFTDFVSPEVSRSLVEHLLPLSPRHLVAVLAISDPALEALATGDAIQTARDAYTEAAADWVLAERAAARAALTQRGISVMDVPPPKLSAAAINKYLAVKQKGLL